MARLARDLARAHRRLDRPFAPADLLSVDIFFDLGACMATSRSPTIGATHSTPRAAMLAFAKLLVEAAGEVEPGLSLFGGFRTEKGRIDLKKTGLFGIVTARACSPSAITCSSARRRRGLSAIAALGRGGGLDLDALARAHAEFLDLILAQQIADIHDGRPPSNKVLVKRLSREQRMRLREALRAVRHLDALTRDLLF